MDKQSSPINGLEALESLSQKLSTLEKQYGSEKELLMHISTEWTHSPVRNWLLENYDECEEGVMGALSHPHKSTLRHSMSDLNEFCRELLEKSHTENNDISRQMMIGAIAQNMQIILNELIKYVPRNLVHAKKDANAMGRSIPNDGARGELERKSAFSATIRNNWNDEWRSSESKKEFADALRSRVGTLTLDGRFRKEYQNFTVVFEVQNCFNAEENKSWSEAPEEKVYIRTYEDDEMHHIFEATFEYATTFPSDGVILLPRVYGHHQENSRASSVSIAYPEEVYIMDKHENIANTATFTRDALGNYRARFSPETISENVGKELRVFVHCEICNLELEEKYLGSAASGKIHAPLLTLPENLAQASVYDLPAIIGTQAVYDCCDVKPTPITPLGATKADMVLEQQRASCVGSHQLLIAAICAKEPKRLIGLVRGYSCVGKDVIPVMQANSHVNVLIDQNIILDATPWSQKSHHEHQHNILIYKFIGNTLKEIQARVIEERKNKGLPVMYPGSDLHTQLQTLDNRSIWGDFSPNICPSECIDQKNVLKNFALTISADSISQRRQPDDAKKLEVQSWFSGMWTSDEMERDAEAVARRHQDIVANNIPIYACIVDEIDRVKAQWVEEFKETFQKTIGTVKEEFWNGAPWLNLLGKPFDIEALERFFKNNESTGIINNGWPQAVRVGMYFSNEECSKTMEQRLIWIHDYLASMKKSTDADTLPFPAMQLLHKTKTTIPYGKRKTTDLNAAKLYQELKEHLLIKDPKTPIED